MLSGPVTTKQKVFRALKSQHHINEYGVDPAAVFTSNIKNYKCGIKPNTTNFYKTMKSVEKLWNEHFPNYLYKQNFLDEQVAKTMKRIYRRR